MISFTFGLLGLVGLVALWLFALISAIKNERLDPTMRLVWVIVIVFVNGLGALLYLIIAPNRAPVSDDSVENWRRTRS